jgi:APA family basic amino acid/polyamine antiporter
LRAQHSSWRARTAAAAHQPGFHRLPHTTRQHPHAQDGLEVKQKDKEMQRVLGLGQLLTFGISAIVGGGIFVVTGLQAKNNAGPSIMLSYLISGVVATLTALCYAE